MVIKVTKLPKSEVEIEGELSPEIFESYYRKALQHVGENLEIPGFRKGKAPENVVVKNVGEMRVLEEMAELALSGGYSKILAEEKVDAIGAPAITITKLARGNPLGFKIKTAVLPEIKLPDYKKLAKSIKEKTPESEKKIEVTDADVDSTILDIRKSRAPKKHMKDGGHSVSTSEELPEFNEEFVKSLGPFKDIEDFKIKLRENIKLEKENELKEKTRLKIIEEIIKETGTEVPEILVESELAKILHKMESDISNMGLKFEDYLGHLKKTRDDLKKEFRNDAEKKAKLGLILNEIAKIEKIVAEEKDIALEVEQILKFYSDADPERARIHAENILTNEKVFQFLENQ